LEGLRRGWVSVRVVKHRPKRIPKYGRVGLANDGKFRVGEDNVLIGEWKAGPPFPYPRTGAELAWSIYRRREYKDQQTWFCEFLMFHRDGRPDRRFTWREFKRHWTGRVYFPPIPEEPGNNGVIESKESIVVFEPFDVRGYITIRIRYEDIHRSDDNYCYIPALRRMRRMTGADLTDPLLGSDVIPDDFEIWREKVKPKMRFRMSIRDMLMPRFYSDKERPPYDPKRMRYCVQMDWEIRPLWVLEVREEPGYAYSRRTVYAEVEPLTFQVSGGEAYDQRGRWWRASAMYPHAPEAKTGELWGFWYYNYQNAITGHQTFMNLGPQTADVPYEAFTIKWLLRKAR